MGRRLVCLLLPVSGVALALGFLVGCSTASLHLAVAEGDREEVASLLDRGADIEGRDYHLPGFSSMVGWSPLMVAIHRNDRDMVELLLAKGARFKDRRMFSWAFFLDRRDIAALLLDRGADIDEKDRAGYTPLHYAVRRGNLDQVRRLLALGAAPAPAAPLQKHLVGGTPMHVAAWQGWLEVAKELFRAGAPVEPGSGSGDTPLGLAVLGRHREMAAWLLTQGADPDGRCRLGCAPLHLAVDRAWRDLQKAKGSATGRLRFAVPTDDGKWTSRLETGEQIVARSLAMIRLLLDRGADVNSFDDQDQTPLDQARILVELELSREIPALLRRAGGREGNEIMTRTGR